MKIFLQLFLLFLICAGGPATAADLDYARFESLPVLHEGRVKPLGSFARIQLRHLSGSDHIKGMEAAPWLAEALFDPTQALERPVFKVSNNELRQLLTLNEEQNLFTLAELQPGLASTAEQAQKILAVPRANLTPAQQELLQLHENALGYMQILRSFSFMLPLDVQVPEKYKTENAKNFAEISKIEQRITEDLKKLIKRKGENPDGYTEEEKQLAQLAFQISMLRQAAQGNDILRILPAGWDDESGLWISPWALTQDRESSPENTAYLKLWERLAAAYRKNDALEWQSASEDAERYVQENFTQHVSPAKLQMEQIYTGVKPLRAAVFLYLIGLAGLIFSAAPKFPRILRILTLRATLLGVAMHATAITLRVYVLARPPVGTLYESVLFVSLICAAAALLLGWRAKNNAVTIAGLFAAAFLLLLAPVAAPRGEDMETLSAVLNTNFWLATHVVCITAGYGACILAASLAHFYMLARLTGKAQDMLSRLQQTAYRVSLTALLFTAVGTILGGIWADQSWGRFWGWDPKENGALLIVLWLIWAQHGRISGHLRPLPFIASLAALNIIVALAWFGVNLLNVGLHSYGFTQGMATGLGLFCGIEILFIGGLWFAIRRREKNRSAHVA